MRDCSQTYPLITASNALHFFNWRCSHRTVWLSHSCSYRGITCAIADKNKRCQGKFEFQMNNNKSFKYTWNIAWVILIQKTNLLLSEIQISLGILYFIWRFSVLFIILKLYKWNAAVRPILTCFIVVGILQTEFHFLWIKWAANVLFG